MVELDSTYELSIVMPCLNEAETLEICINKAKKFLYDHDIAGEIVVADNGSTDGSQDIANNLNVKLIHVSAKGYGAALMGGIAAAKGQFVIMGDADDSYDFTNLMPFVEKLRAGYDLVMGNRFKGGIKSGAMPALHRYLGNPVLTKMGQIFFKSLCGDFHCGLRGFRKEAIMGLNLRTTGMEFASEMVVKATLYKLCITEVPTTLSPDGRSRAPHLRSWRDGWRHLRFLLLYSPRWLFLYPGLLLILVGIAVSAWLLPGPQTIQRVTFDVHTLLYAAMAVLIGFQAVIFAVFTKVFAITEGLLPTDPRLNKLFKYITLEVGLLTGIILGMIGLGGSVIAFIRWSVLAFGPLNPAETLRVIIPSATILMMGCQVILYSFFLSIMGVHRQE
jgi:glycosyltransferase involved in cell wall biosynthesis